MLAAPAGAFGAWWLHHRSHLSPRNVYLAAGLALVIGGTSLRRDAARLARQLAAEAGEPGPQGR